MIEIPDSGAHEGFPLIWLRTVDYPSVLDVICAVLINVRRRGSKLFEFALGITL